MPGHVTGSLQWVANRVLTGRCLCTRPGQRVVTLLVSCTCLPEGNGTAGLSFYGSILELRHKGLPFPRLASLRRAVIMGFISPALQAHEASGASSFSADRAAVPCPARRFLIPDGIPQLCNTDFLMWAALRVLASCQHACLLKGQLCLEDTPCSWDHGGCFAVDEGMVTANEVHLP